MTDLDLTKLRKIAEDARDAFERQDFLDMIETGNTRRRALDPTTVIALIDEIERLRETLATVKAITVGTPECDKYDDKSPVTCGWKFDLQRIKEVVK